MRTPFDIPKFLDWVVQSWAPVAVLADHVAFSRSHFSRLLSAAIGESPRALRSRLRLEAGAHLLRASDFTIGEIAVEVGYATPEAFTKAFRRGFQCAPREFRRRTGPTWIESSSGIHFHPSGIVVRRQGASNMNLNQILMRHHLEEVELILADMAGLSDEELDRESLPSDNPIPWDTHAPSLRGAMDATVFTEEVWLAALTGGPMPERIDKPSAAGLIERHKVAGKALHEFFNEVEEKDLWASEFVDALCEEPTRFPFGGVFAHIFVFAAHRRLLCLSVLRAMDRQVGYGDPLNWMQGDPRSMCS